MLSCLCLLQLVNCDAAQFSLLLGFGQFFKEKSANTVLVKADRQHNNHSGLS